MNHTLDKKRTFNTLLKDNYIKLNTLQQFI